MSSLVPTGTDGPSLEGESRANTIAELVSTLENSTLFTKNPEYKTKPAVVAHGQGSGSEIASCNYPAREYGFKNGMWMKRALELCPNLKILPYDFPAYEEASRAFYDAILATGGLVQSASIDEALDFMFKSDTLVSVIADNLVIFIIQFRVSVGGWRFGW